MVILIKYTGIAFALALIVVLFNVFSATGHIHGVWHGVKYLFWLTVGPGVGMTLGAAARLWLMPDEIYTREGMAGLFKARVFWLIGPQSIGWLAGLIAVSEGLR